MNVEDLKGLSNRNVDFRVSGDALMIRSLTCPYADYMRLDIIRSVRMISDRIIAVSVPNGTFMGCHELEIDLDNGVVTADGKVYDRPLPVRPKARKQVAKLRPSINGFSVRKVHTMPSTDGYAVSCEVCFDGEKVGDFLDKGDGELYSFLAVKPFDTDKIMSTVRGFPPIKRNYGFGRTEFQYDMGLLVDGLVELEEIARKVRKLGKGGKDYVRIDDWKHARHFGMVAGKNVEDGKITEFLKDKGLGECEIRRFRNCADLMENSCQVTRDDLLGY